MITLRTGIPRHGKSLHMVQGLFLFLNLLKKHEEQGRPIFAHNIYGLALPHNPLPMKEWKADKAGSVVLVPDWDLVPDGAFVFIDECDKIFPPRSASVTPPYHVNWLTEHGHHGIDIELTTQHPKFIDAKVRALVGKHLHFRRLFGGLRSTIYEWDSCNDSLTNFSSAVLSHFEYPKSIFHLYKSATIHTKQNFKLPRWLIIPAAGLLLGIYSIPHAYHVLSSGMSGKGLGVQSAQAEPLTKGEKASESHSQTEKQKMVPPVDPGKVPDTPFTRPVVVAAACLANSTHCQCYTNEGVVVSLPDAICRTAALQNINFADLHL